MKPLMSQQSYDYIYRVANLAPVKYESELADLSSTLISQCGSWIKPHPDHSPAKRAQQLFDNKFPKVTPVDSNILKLSLVAKLAKKTYKLVEKENLPESILAYYPDAFDRLCTALKKTEESPIDAAKDLFHRIGLVLAINIPCGAQLLDLRSSIPILSVIYSVPRERSIKSLIHYTRCQGHGIWFRGHTDTEFLDDFSEEGWDQFYLRVAELLLRRTSVRGLVGTSWFYDPQLLDISPRLSYLQLRQLERGAFLMRHRGSESDVKFATKTSKTRRILYE